MDNVTRIVVFVASPGDVQKERDAVKDIVEDLNDSGVFSDWLVLQTKMWETHAWPGFGDDAQAVINEQIGDYDIFVGILWNRLGTPTNRAPSGTVEEFERAYQAWKEHKHPSLLFYFNRQPFDFTTAEDLKQKQQVLDFKASLVKLGGLYWEYTSLDQFSKEVRRHLIQEVKKAKPPADGATAPRPGAGTPEQQALSKIQSLANKLGYWHQGLSMQVFSDIEQVAAKSGSPMVKDAAIAALKEFVGGGLRQDSPEATARARQLRKAAFATLRRCAYRDLGTYFNDGELESLDLFAVDFSAQRLAGVSFGSAFLIEASFECAVLDAASFHGAWIRNVNFSGASLKGTDLTGADWFNALHLTAGQLQDVKPGSLLRPPQSVDEMLAYLRGHYGLPFESWSPEVQQNLRAAWNNYLKPGGLRDLVNLPA